MGRDGCHAVREGAGGTAPSQASRCLVDGLAINFGGVCTRACEAGWGAAVPPRFAPLQDCNLEHDFKIKFRRKTGLPPFLLGTEAKKAPCQSQGQHSPRREVDAHNDGVKSWHFLKLPVHLS